MVFYRQKLFFIMTTTCLLSSNPAISLPDQHWHSVPDSVYLQEEGRRVKTGFPLSAVAVFRGEVYTGCERGILQLAGDELIEPATSPAGPVRRLATFQNLLWAVTDAGLHRFDGDSWTTVQSGVVHGLCEHRGEVHFATASELMVVREGQAQPVEGASVNRQLVAIASFAETLYFLYPGRLVLFDGEKMDWENVIDWGALPSSGCRDFLPDGSRLVIATDRGLGVLRGMSLNSVTGREGLCYEDTTCLAEGFENDIWIGTKRGAIRMVGNEYQFFGPTRWLPDEDVHAIACGPHEVYIATDGGLGILEYEPFTLRKKAAFYERHLDEWGQKRLGFVHQLIWETATDEWVRMLSDNDGGWTDHYLAAMSYKYAVTRDEADREEAVRAFLALRFLLDVTPIKGYVARSVYAEGEKSSYQVQQGSGGFPAEWHGTDDGLWEWKGDTSSDEVVAHFYAVPIFLELAAKGEEKDLAVDFLVQIASHIIDNGWVLRDLDGEPTRWGRWDPEYLQRPAGFSARGLNGMQALSFMETALALSGNPKFEEARDAFVQEGYQDDILRQKITFPPSNITHFDDRLSFLAYPQLLRYTKDPNLRSIYRRSLDRSWEIVRIQRNPWLNYLYGMLTGDDCEEEASARHLQEWPLDLVKYRYHNSHRHDLREPSGYTAYAAVPKVLSPRETGARKWDWTLGYDREPDGIEVEDPSGWLEAYWMGRYCGFIQAPLETDPDLISVPKRGLQLGAKPYEGPPLPSPKRSVEPVSD